MLLILDLFQTDPDLVIVTSYEMAMRTGYNFLSVFLKKYGSNRKCF